MRQIVTVIVLVMMVTGLILAGCAPAAPESQPSQPSTPTTPTPTPTEKPEVITITWAEQNFEQAWGPVNSEIPYMKRIEEACGGRVKIEPYWGQTMVKGPDIWEAVKTGVVDAGWCFHNYWPGMTDLANSISLPGLPFPNCESVGAVIYQIYHEFPSIQQEFSDVHVMTPWGDGYQAVITNKKQIKTLNDFKGLKLRTSGTNPTEMLKALGATPMMCPMPDSYLSLEKGTFDGMTAGHEANLSFRLYEVTDYQTFGPFGSYFFTYSMNKDKWNSLPADIQEAITSVNTVENAMMLSKGWGDVALESLNEQIKAGGHDVTQYTLPASEVEKLSQISAPIQQAWVEKMTEAGHPEAQDILDRMKELIAQAK